MKPGEVVFEDYDQMDREELEKQLMGSEPEPEPKADAQEVKDGRSEPKSVPPEDETPVDEEEEAASAFTEELTKPVEDNEIEALRRELNNLKSAVRQERDLKKKLRAEKERLEQVLNEVLKKFQEAQEAKRAEAQAAPEPEFKIPELPDEIADIGRPIAEHVRATVYRDLTPYLNLLYDNQRRLQILEQAYAQNLQAYQTQQRFASSYEEYRQKIPDLEQRLQYIDQWLLKTAQSLFPNEPEQQKYYVITNLSSLVQQPMDVLAVLAERLGYKPGGVKADADPQPRPQQQVKEPPPRAPKSLGQIGASMFSAPGPEDIANMIDKANHEELLKIDRNLFEEALKSQTIR